MSHLDLFFDAADRCPECGRTDGTRLPCAWHPDEPPVCVDYGRGCVCPACVQRPPRHDRATREDDMISYDKDSPQLDFDTLLLVRSTDPYTSVWAAQKALKASAKAVLAVASAMSDGEEYTDEELWRACRQAGYIASLDTVQHGRLALSRGGGLVETGETRLTTDGMPSRVWRKADGLDLTKIESARFDGPGPKGP
ncbi:MAG: hypothetical protein ABIE42_05750 [Candidatus Eisenbacteria bacterium]